MIEEMRSKMSDRKYTVDELDRMRRAIERCYPSGVPYMAAQRAAEVEDRLRTHMQNGTEPKELEEAAAARFQSEMKERNLHDEFVQEVMKRRPPPPPPPKSAQEVLERWFDECVAQYPDASVEAKDLYDGYSGRTLTSYANQHAPDGVNITQSDMEKFLDKKGIRSRRAMFNKRYDGIRHVIHGDVRSGNYST